MLANHFGVGVVVCSCESFVSSVRARGPEPLCAYLLYTGQHYDPMLGTEGTLVFSSSSDAEVVAAREAGAIELAKKHNQEAAERAPRRLNLIKCSPGSEPSVQHTESSGRGAISLAVIGCLRAATRPPVTGAPAGAILDDGAFQGTA